MYYEQLHTPLGTLLIAGDDLGVRRIAFGENGRAGWTRDATRVRDAMDQIRAYFAGRLHRFDLVPAPEGTAFQKRVWSALQTIPYGETIRYGQLAERLGKPSAARAVGSAAGKNPIAIVIPCHRLVGHDGRLTGYAYGTERKRQLLDLEQGRSSKAAIQLTLV